MAIFLQLWKPKSLDSFFTFLFLSHSPFHLTEVFLCFFSIYIQIFTSSHHLHCFRLGPSHHPLGLGLLEQVPNLFPCLFPCSLYLALFNTAVGVVFSMYESHYIFCLFKNLPVAFHLFRSQSQRLKNGLDGSVWSGLLLWFWLLLFPLFLLTLVSCCSLGMSAMLLP